MASYFLFTLLHVYLFLVHYEMCWTSCKSAQMHIHTKINTSTLCVHTLVHFTYALSISTERGLCGITSLCLTRTWLITWTNTGLKKWSSCSSVIWADHNRSWSSFSDLSEKPLSHHHHLLSNWCHPLKIRLVTLCSMRKHAIQAMHQLYCLPMSFDPLSV